MSIDGRYRLETPENVELDFELSGPGSRFCALLLDITYQVLFTLALVLVLILSVSAWFQSVTRDFKEAVRGEGSWLQWSIALVIVFLFLVWGGYFLFFELVMHGQTPGKRSMKLRVIREDGTPASATDLIVRNLLRLVDFLPAFYGLGGVVAFFHPMHQRLGDLAAGTIVVKEGEPDYRANADAKKVAVVVPHTISNTELSPEERRILSIFLARRVEMLPQARTQMARQLAQSLHAHHGGRLGDPEVFLERLSMGRQNEANEVERFLERLSEGESNG